MRRPDAALIACTVLAGFVALEASSATLQDAAMPPAVDYGWDWPIETGATANFYEFELRIDVYRSVSDPGLRDIGVYNAAWEAVPRLVTPAEDRKALPERSAQVAALPVRAPAGTPVGDMRLALEKGDAGTRVRIESDALPADAGLAALVAYVADLGEVHKDLAGITIEWPREIEPLIVSMTVEGSADFEQWIPLGRGVVAGLREGDASIERQRVNVVSLAVRYLRLTWDAAPSGWRIDRLQLNFATPAPAVEREWLELESSGRDSTDGGYLFEIGGVPPVDRLSLQLPDENRLVHARILVWSEQPRRWLAVHEGSFYRMRREGNAIASEPAAIASQRASRWKVIIEQGAGELRFGLRLGWRNDRVHFMAQGQGPWRLVAGNSDDASMGFPQDRRYADPAIRGLLEKSEAVGQAQLGSRDELGGPARLGSPNLPEWRRWLLWLGLAAGVLLVAFLVLRLARQRPADEPKA